MTVNELLNNIRLIEDYFPNSIHLISSDNSGCVYKYLYKSNTLGIRKEIFIELNPEEFELNLLDKTVVSSIEVFPAK